MVKWMVALPLRYGRHPVGPASSIAGLLLMSKESARATEHVICGIPDVSVADAASIHSQAVRTLVCKGWCTLEQVFVQTVMRIVGPAAVLTKCSHGQRRT